MRKKTFIVFIVIILTLISNKPVFATNLNELYHPLLKKGQLRQDVGLDIDSVRQKNNAWDITGGQTNYQDNKFRFINYKGISKTTYGINDKLQFKFNVENVFPYRYHNDNKQSTTLPDATVFLTDVEEKDKFERNCILSQELRVRPNDRFDIFIEGSQGWRKDSVHTDIRNDTTTQKEKRDLYAVKVGGTYLNTSSVKFDPLKPNLSGLTHPLLDKGQFKMNFEYYWYYLLDALESAELGPRAAMYFDPWQTRTSFSELTYEINYGIRDNLQLDLTFDYTLPHSIEWVFGGIADNYGLSVQVVDARQKIKIDEILNPKVKLTKRFNEELQFYLSSDYIHYRIRATTTQTNVFTPDGFLGNTTRDEETQRLIIDVNNADLRFGFNWVSKSKGKGVVFTQDLDGLEHPLLEKGQIRVDGSWQSYFYNEAQKVQFNISDYSFGWHYQRYTMNSKLYYGLFNKLQVGLFLNYRFPYGFQYEFISEDQRRNFIMEDYDDKIYGGFQIVYRPRKNFQVLLDVSYNPQIEGYELLENVGWAVNKSTRYGPQRRNFKTFSDNGFSRSFTEDKRRELLAQVKATLLF